MGRNNQNSKWAGHQQLDGSANLVENLPSVELKEEVHVIVPAIEETVIEGNLEVQSVIESGDETIEEPIEEIVEKEELKPIVKKNKTKE